MVTNWIYQGNEITELPEEVFGFIYHITLPNGLKYIGKKGCHNKTGKWQTYFSSSKLIKEYIQNNGKDGIERVILKLCYNNLQLSYYEENFLHKFDALTKPDYLNQNIAVKYVKHKLIN